jgi:CheY-like chemotaxis protein
MQLSGKRVLVVEDEMIVAMCLEDSLTSMGAEVVGPAMRLDAAVELARSEGLHGAVLDINLHGERSYPVADILQERGVPFVFATGYGHAEGYNGFNDVPVLKKPYRDSELASLLTAVMFRDPGRE